MELLISLEEVQSKQAIIQLKNFIDKASIDGIQQTEIQRTIHEEGQMGGGDLLTTIKTIIEAAASPLTELVKCLQKFVDNYRTEITLEGKNGEKIVLSHGRSMKPEELGKMVSAIQKGMS